MTENPKQIERIAKMSFASVYPHYVEKVVRKGRTVHELHEVIEWLTGYDELKIQEIIENKITFESFFEMARLHPDSSLVKGSICGYKVEEIQNPLLKNVRILDKIIDELAKGKKLDKIFRK